MEEIGASNYCYYKECQKKPYNQPWARIHYGLFWQVNIQLPVFFCLHKMALLNYRNLLGSGTGKILDV